MSKYDFIVIGGGHNGLISAGYLGKAGFKVCVLEANDDFGGGTRSGEVCAPGYISDLGGMVHSMISKNPLITNDELELQSKYGFKYIPVTNLCASIFPDNTCLVIDTDLDKTCQNIAQFSEKDAESYRKFHKYINDMLKVARVGLDTPPPTWSLMQSALGSSPEGREFIRVMNSSAQNIVEEWFESEQLRVTLTRWTTELMINPQAVGTASLLYFLAWVHNLRAPIPEGGAKKLIEALMASCQDKGATLRTNSKVVKVNVAGGEAKSVVLEDGEEIFAEKGIISTINIKDLYGSMLGDAASEPFRDRAKKLKHCAFMALNQSFALKKVPEFKCGDYVKTAFCIEAAPEEKEFLKIFNDFKFGEFSPNIPLLTMPSLFDKTRAPEGHCVLNVYNYAPYNLYGDAKNWANYKQELADAVWEFTKGLFTNISDDDIIGNRWIFDPTDYEKWDLAFKQGDIGMIGMQPDQMYAFRPFVGTGQNYVGDIENLYTLGSCSHPGGGIAGAARAGIQVVLEDFGVDFKALNK